MRTHLPHRSDAPAPCRARQALARLAIAAGVTAAVAIGSAAAAAAQVGGRVDGGPADGGPKAPVTVESSGSTGLLIAAAIATLVILVAVVVVAVLVSRSRSGSRRAATPIAPPAAAGPVGGPPPLPADGGRAANERDRLVQVLVELGDQLDSVALRSWVTQALDEVGVTTVLADGQRFDPARHQAVDQVATTDPSAVGVVAQTVRAGYVDRERLLRLPQVVVYGAGAAS